MKLGWYVHHHGAGHRTRFAAVAPLLDDVTALSSLPLPGGVRLPLDVADTPLDPSAGGTLHWVPVGHAGLRERMACISAWIATHEPDVFVVDVSVEVALLARLHGVPTVIVAQRGRRDDVPHGLAFAQAAAVVAPWTAAAHAPTQLPVTPRFVGAISRFDDRDFRAPGDDVLLLLGAGGDQVDRARVPGHWLVADGGAPVADLLERCSVVVGSAGGNVVAEVAAARRPFVCLPQERPFDEQLDQAHALEALGVAVVCREWPDDWAVVLDRAAALDTERWSLLHDGRGAERFAAVIEEVAACAPR